MREAPGTSRADGGEHAAGIVAAGGGKRRRGDAASRLRAAVSRERVLAGLAAGYFVVAAIGIVAPSSANAIADGRVWLLLTSALAAQGPLPLVQVAIAAAAAALAISRAGAATWWRSVLAGHIGSALVAYALIAIAGAGRAAATPDYGVSCVLGATMGVLLADRRIRAVGAIGAIALLPLSFSWIGLEHPLAVLIGAGVTARGARAPA